MIRGIPEFGPGHLLDGSICLTVLEDRFELQYIGAIVRIEGEAFRDAGRIRPSTVT